MVIVGIGIVVVLAALALRKVPHFVVAEATTDTACTVIGDFCMNVNCIFQNRGGASGEQRVGARLIDSATERVVATRASTLALPAEGIRRLTFAFVEAEVERTYRGQCLLE